MRVIVGNTVRRLAWNGISPRYSGLKVVSPGEKAVPRSSNNEAVIASLTDWVRDQLDEGACASFAGLYAMRWLAVKLGLPTMLLSPQDLYFNVRQRIHTWPNDSGSTMTDVSWTLHADGVAMESDWPYVSGQYNQRPPAACSASRFKHKSLDAFSIPGNQTALSILHSRGPFIVGIPIYSNFPGIQGSPDDGTGLVSLPTIFDQYLGGHGVCIMDYSLDPKTYVRLGKTVVVHYPHLVMVNSWSAQWGHAGFCYLPLTMMDQGMLQEMISILREKDVV